MTASCTVLMTTDAVGGVWRYAVDLAAGLGAHGVRVVLAVMGPPPAADQRREVATLRNVVLEEGRFRLEWMDGGLDDLDAAGDWLASLERRWWPDVVHLNGYAAGALPWRAPVVMTAHSCVLSWWRAVKGVEAPPSWDAYGDAVARGLRGAAVVTAPTRAFLDEILHLYGPLPAARVVRNGANPARFRPRPHEDGGRTPEILAAGRLWDEAKGLDVLAAAGADLPWPLAVAGQSRGPDGQAVALDGVRMLGRLSRAALARRMEKAAIFAAPARYEPFGLAVLEAALGGCALVLADIPTFREVWDDAALFVPPEGGSDAWARALRGLAEEPARRADLGHRARVRGLGHGAEATVAGTLAAYRAAMAAQRVVA